MNKKDLRALTLVRPTRDNPVLDLLAVLHLDSQLFISCINFFKINFQARIAASLKLEPQNTVVTSRQGKPNPGSSANQSAKQTKSGQYSVNKEPDLPEGGAVTPREPPSSETSRQKMVSVEIRIGKSCVKYVLSYVYMLYSRWFNQSL